MNLENIHLRYLHRILLIYVGIFLSLLFIYSVISILSNRVGFPIFYFVIMIFISGFYLYRIYKNFNLKIDYKKNLEKDKIIITSVLTILVFGLRYLTSFYLSYPLLIMVTFLPLVILDSLLFAMANFYPFKQFTLAFFAPLKFIAEVYYLYFLAGLINPFIRLFYKKNL